MSSKIQLSLKERGVVPVSIVLLMCTLAVVAAEPAAATNHGCFTVFTNDADGDETSTYVYIESIYGDYSDGSETSDDSSCERDDNSETSYEGYIFNAPSGEYYLQVYDDDTSELWGLYEVYISEEGVVSDNIEILDRGAVYATYSEVTSPRGTTRLQPGETATVELGVSNGQLSGSNDVEVEVYVHDPSDSLSTPTETFSYDVSAQDSETFTPEFTVPSSEGEYEITTVIRTDTVRGYFISDTVSVGTIDVDAFEPPEIASHSPGDGFVTLNSDEATRFAVSVDDPDTAASSLAYTWSVDGRDVATGDSFSLNPDEYSEGEHSVEVEVSDGTTETADAFEFWTVDISYEPPEIDSTSPSDSAVEAAGSDGTTFSVSSSDADSTDLSHTWDVDDRAVASGTEFTFDPSDYSGGEYDVEVVVSDDSTETADASRSWTVEVIEGPEIEAADPGSSEADIGSPVTFSAEATDPGGYTPLSYEWTIDSQLYDGAEVTRTFTSTDDVSAELEVSNSRGVSTTRSFVVDIEAVPPQIDEIRGGGSAITAGESVTLSATAFDPADRDVSMSYSWDILDATYDGASVTASPTTVGQHDVSLTATNEYGTSTTQTTTITVNNDSPELSARDDSDRRLTAGQSERFTVLLADSDASDTELELIVDGDPVESREISQAEADETFSYQFSSPGERSVEITATDGSGASTTVSWTVDVASRPPEFETWGPEESSLYALTGSTFEFDVTASDPDGQAVSYQWYIDGSYVTSGESLTRQFVRNGQYTVEVVATDSDNTTSERVWNVAISSFNEQPIIADQISAVTIDEDSTTEFATVSLSNPEANNRTAEVEVIVRPPDGLSVTSVANVQSGSPSQYQVSDSARPGSSTSLTLGLQLNDETLLGQTVTVDYSVIYYPEGQRADSVVLNNSTQEIAIGDQTTATPGRAQAAGGSGDGFTPATAVLGVLLLTALLVGRRE